MTRSHTHSRRDRGAAALEFALVVPALGLLLGLVVGGARIWFARASVEQLAGSAARAATVAPSAGLAASSARSLIADQLAGSGVRCATVTVDVDTSAFGLAPGTTGRVTVQVRCAVPLADLLVPGWPGTLDVSATGQSVLDPYRRRTP